MVIAIAIAGQQKVVFCNLHIVEYILLDVLIHLVFDGQFANRRQRICHIDTQLVLMTIHRKNGNLRSIVGSFNSRDIAIGIQGHIDFACLSTLDIKAVHTYLRINLSWNGILISIVARIFGKLAALRLQALKQLHRVLLNCTLIIANPDDLL